MDSALAKSLDIVALKQQLSFIDFYQANNATDIENHYFQAYGLDFERHDSGVKHGFGKFKSGDYEIALHYFHPPNEPKGTVFIVHGYFDHSGLFHHLIEFCLQQHYSVIIYDLPGHGLSTGDRASINSFDDYRNVLIDCLTLCQGEFMKPWFAIGQSTGSAVLLDYLTTENIDKEFNPFRHVVLLAPLIKPRRWWLSDIMFSLLGGLIDHKKRKFSNNSHDKNFLDFIKYDDQLQSRQMPMRWVASLQKWINRLCAAKANNNVIHVIQGTDDRTVDWRLNLPHIERIFSGMPHLLIKHARHHLTNETKEIREKIFDKLKQWLR